MKDPHIKMKKHNISFWGQGTSTHFILKEEKEKGYFNPEGNIL